MAASSDSTFITLAGLMLLAAFVCGPAFGAGTTIPALIAVYFMLVATNAISRGENKAKRFSKRNR